MNEWPIYQVAQVSDFFAFLYGHFIMHASESLLDSEKILLQLSEVVCT